MLLVSHGLRWTAPQIVSFLYIAYNYITHQTSSAVVALPEPLALAAQVTEVANIQLIAPNSSALPPWLSQAKKHREARYVRVRERQAEASGRAGLPLDDNKGKRKDWLPLLIREHLGQCMVPWSSAYSCLIVLYLDSGFKVLN